jgi:hypothetical protein
MLDEKARLASLRTGCLLWPLDLSYNLSPRPISFVRSGDHLADCEARNHVYCP